MEVFNKETGIFEKIRCFLDRGSNRTFATTACAKRCGFSVVSDASMYISTFGSQARKVNLKLAKVDLYKNIKTLKDPLSVNVFIMTDLELNVNAFELSDRQKLFIEQNNIELADNQAAFSGELEVDMLLGQDCVHSITNGESLYLPGGSILVPTWDGRYILAGPLDSECHKNTGRKVQFKAPHFLAVKTLSTLPKGTFPRKIRSLMHKVFSCVASEEELEVIETFRDLEMMGISPLEYESSPILDDFNKTTMMVKDTLSDYLLRTPKLKVYLTIFYRHSPGY